MEQVIDVAETLTTLVHALPPIVTVAPAAKFVPVMVIAVPPAVDPEVGEVEVIVGKTGSCKGKCSFDESRYIDSVGGEPRTSNPF